MSHSAEGRDSVPLYTLAKSPRDEPGSQTLDPLATKAAINQEQRFPRKPASQSDPLERLPHPGDAGDNPGGTFEANPTADAQSVLVDWMEANLGDATQALLVVALPKSLTFVPVHMLIGVWQRLLGLVETHGEPHLLGMAKFAIEGGKGNFRGAVFFEAFPRDIFAELESAVGKASLEWVGKLSKMLAHNP